MGKGRKSKREMVILVRKLQRARALKKVGKKTFSSKGHEAEAAEETAAAPAEVAAE